MANGPIKAGVTLGTVKLWVGVGAFVMTGAAPVPAQTPAPPSHVGHATPAPGQGGEGGEGGEAGGLESASPDVGFATRLLLVRGHLGVGMELARAGSWDEAVVHFLHPAEELYGDLRPELRRRRAPDFKARLDGLATRVRAKRGGAGLDRAYREVLADIDRALTAGVPQRVRTSPAFVADVAARGLRTAASEYFAAIEDGRFANVVEYQDGRGFVTEVGAFLQRHEKMMATHDAAAWRQASEAFNELRRAWPAIRPPEQPVLSRGEVSAFVSRFELTEQSWK